MTYLVFSRMRLTLANEAWTYYWPKGPKLARCYDEREGIFRKFDMTIHARYENGVFRPLEEVTIKEGTFVEVHVPAVSEPPLGRRSIKDLSFYGLWADRDDITDGVSYVNDLRDNPRG